MSEAPPFDRLLDLTGKVALVTGAGGNIGQAIARRLAEAGAAVARQYHSTPAGGAHAFRADVADETSVAALIRAVVERLGRLDILVNNAGIYPVASLLELSAQHWDETLAPNLRGVHLCTRAAAQRMIDQGSGGAIVNITTIEAHQPAPAHSHYAASKAAVAMYTRSAALELGPHGIRVNAVAPGLIWREGIEQSWPDGVERWLKHVPLARLGQPDDIAAACLFLASPAARWITGASLTVDGGMLTHPLY